MPKAHSVCELKCSMLSPARRPSALAGLLVTLAAALAALACGLLEATHVLVGFIWTAGYLLQLSPGDEDEADQDKAARPFDGAAPREPLAEASAEGRCGGLPPAPRAPRAPEPGPAATAAPRAPSRPPAQPAAELPPPEPPPCGGTRSRSSAVRAQAAGQALELPAGCAMLVLKTVPRRYTQDLLAEHLQAVFSREDIDLVHLPIDLKSGRHLGYALVGFRTPAGCARFAAEFHLASMRELLPGANRSAVCELSPAKCSSRAEFLETMRASPALRELCSRRPACLPILLGEQ